MATNPRTKPPVNQAAHYVSCDYRALPSELRIPRDQVAYVLRVRLEPHDERSRGSNPLCEFQVFCDGQTHTATGATMANGWIANQYRLFRILLGAYL